METPKKNVWIEIAGWYGVAALLGAYVLATFGFLDVSDIWFQTLNLTGAIGIVIDSLAQKNWQPAVLNIVWAIVGLVALAKIIL